jgi:hypothetical protein
VEIAVNGLSPAEKHQTPYRSGRKPDGPTTVKAGATGDAAAVPALRWVAGKTRRNLPDAGEIPTAQLLTLKAEAKDRSFC